MTRMLRIVAMINLILATLAFLSAYYDFFYLSEDMNNEILSLNEQIGLSIIHPSDKFVFHRYYYFFLVVLHVLFYFSSLSISLWVLLRIKSKKFLIMLFALYFLCYFAWGFFPHYVDFWGYMWLFEYSDFVTNILIGMLLMLLLNKKSSNQVKE